MDYLLKKLLKKINVAMFNRATTVELDQMPLSCERNESDSKAHINVK
jgi:hypothetical protein